MYVRSVEWVNDSLRIIDQNKLPGELAYLDMETYEELGEAIQGLKVRGAPAIGIAAAFGVVLAVKRVPGGERALFFEEVDKAINHLKAIRPTAVNLHWALNRIRTVVTRNSNRLVSEIKDLMLQEARAILEEDRQMCRAIGENGAVLLPRSATVLTHCNAGALATGGIGTALAIVTVAHEMGKKVKVYIDETRPLLQGARLTAWELRERGVDATLICDSAAAYVMQRKLIDCVLVGADRIAGNGDVANKVGTYNLAVLALYHQVPLYVAAPYSTLDLHIDSGASIPIEERGAEEITTIAGVAIAPQGVHAYNPAFDVTPHELITAIINEKGVIKPPFAENLRRNEKSS